MFEALCEAWGIQRRIRLCFYPLRISQLKGLEWQEAVTGTPVKYHGKTEGRTSDFAHGHLGRCIRADGISIRL